MFRSVFRQRGVPIFFCRILWPVLTLSALLHAHAVKGSLASVLLLPIAGRARLRVSERVYDLLALQRGCVEIVSTF